MNYFFLALLIVSSCQSKDSSENRLSSDAKPGDTVTGYNQLGEKISCELKSTKADSCDLSDGTKKFIEECKAAGSKVFSCGCSIQLCSQSLKDLPEELPKDTKSCDELYSKMREKPFLDKRFTKRVYQLTEKKESWKDTFLSCDGKGEDWLLPTKTELQAARSLFLIASSKVTDFEVKDGEPNRSANRGAPDCAAPNELSCPACEDVGNGVPNSDCQCDCIPKRNSKSTFCDINLWSLDKNVFNPKKAKEEGDSNFGLCIKKR